MLGVDHYTLRNEKALVCVVVNLPTVIVRHCLKHGCVVCDIQILRIIDPIFCYNTLNTAPITKYSSVFLISLMTMNSKMATFNKMKPYAMPTTKACLKSAVFF